VYEREGQDFDPREAYPFVHKAMRDDDANDPALESHLSFAKHQESR
jgi:hypothetical protein